MTLSELCAALSGFDPDLPLRLVAGGEALRGDYHVTELQVLDVASIICDGTRSSWGEARMQVLDGMSRSAAPMSVGKFLSIVNRAVAEMPGLSDLPLKVECAPGHGALQVYDVGVPVVEGAAVVLRFKPTTALCKAVPRAPVVSCCGTGAAVCCRA